MERTLSRMQAYLRLAEAFARARESREVCEAGLDCVREQLGIERSAILIFDDEGVLRFRAHRGLSAAYRTAVEGHSPWTRDSRRPEPIIVLDPPSAGELGALRDVLRAEGITRLAFVPLAARGRLIGKLMLYGGEPEQYGEERMREAVAVADLIATALDGHEGQEQLRRANALLSTLMDNLPEATALIDERGRLVYATRRVEEFFGLTPETVMGCNHEQLFQAVAERIERAEDFRGHCRAAAAAGQPLHLELKHVDGRVFELTCVPATSLGVLCGQLMQLRDVTARHDLEGRLRHAHKMESIGRLAGGVAHDFNNMLTAMIGYMDLVAAGLPPEAEEQGYLTQALAAAEQASDLTRQLLAFARRQPVQPTAQDMNALLERMGPLLRRLVPEDIEIVSRPEAKPGWVLADAGQLEQVLVNLAFNARDAMPDGGLLALATSREAATVVGEPDHVVLEVADTGVGMDDETRERLFEPFYTTKQEGRGAGLGLATVYGIVQQFGGRVEVASAPGRGARFRIVLPATDVPAAPDAGDGGPGGHETVLLVEDDASVRGLVSAMLARLGYVVIAAERSDEALAMLERHRGDVDLLIADMVMPGMSGRELASRALAARPRLRVLLMSGYAATGSGPHAAGGFAFMPKPFSIETLARRVRETLAAPALVGEGAGR